MVQAKEKKLAVDEKEKKQERRQRNRERENERLEKEERKRANQWASECANKKDKDRETDFKKGISALEKEKTVVDLLGISDGACIC